MLRLLLTSPLSFGHIATLLFSVFKFPFSRFLDDGALRVWKNFADQKNPEMVTAWQGLSDMLPTTRGQPSTSAHSKDLDLTILPLTPPIVICVVTLSILIPICLYSTVKILDYYRVPAEKVVKALNP